MTNIKETPSGQYFPQNHENGNYWSFLPNALPPNINYDNELMFLGMEAQRYLSELGARSTQIPSPDLFVWTFMRKEAEFSCQIEGTISSIQDAIEEEAGVHDDEPDDRMDIVNYLKAMKNGLEILQDTEISNWFVRSVHETLIQHQPDKNPGKYRTTQNQIGGFRQDPKSADFIPPDPVEVLNCMDNLIKFINNKDVKLAPLIKIALVHAQFETIHPFDDGNGRVGRQLITFQLCKDKIIDKPILYLSYYFKKNKEDYNKHLQKLHDEGTWEEWLKFFLKGIIETCKNALELADKIDNLATNYINLIQDHFGSGKTDSPYQLLYSFFTKPIMSVPEAEEILGRSKGYTYNLFNEFCNLGIIKEITKQERNKKYEFSDYLTLLKNTVTS